MFVIIFTHIEANDLMLKMARSSLNTLETNAGAEPKKEFM